MDRLRKPTAPSELSRAAAEERRKANERNAAEALNENLRKYETQRKIVEENARIKDELIKKRQKHKEK